MPRIAALLSFFLACLASVAPAADRAALPQFETAAKLVGMYFERQPGYQKGDIITREQASEVFRYLKKLNWDVRDQRQILEQVYSEKDFLPKTLRAKSGAGFMRQVAKLPQGYDRVDRLSQLPRGKQTVVDLTKEKDGYKMIEYMADSKGGKNMGKMLSNVPRGADFNQPTGKIYTADHLIKRLQESYDKAAGKP
jgi:hypothetical protein